MNRCECRQGDCVGQWNLEENLFCVRVSDIARGIPPEVSQFDTMAAKCDRLRSENAELRTACEAAIRYADAISKRVVDGSINIIATGGAVAMGDDLDELFDDWIAKSRAAIAKATGDPI